MKYTTFDEFIQCFADTGDEESLWEMIDDYRKWRIAGEIGDCMLRSNAKAFCSSMGIPINYHTECMEHTAMSIYEYFALKYREMTK